MASSEDLPDSVRKCFSLWRSAKSDNERLAVLLLVAKVMRNEDVGSAARRRIFDTIGFTFINRLLVTEYDEEKAGYQQVAVAILVCFCTDTELSLHPQITSKVPTLIDLLTAKPSSPSLIADCLHCIQFLSASEKGRQHLWRYDTLGSLCRYWLLQREDGSCEVTKDVILRLLCDAQLIASNLSPLSSTLEYLSTQFKCRQDKQKFDICQLLKDMIMVGETTTKDSEQVWLADIAVGLQDILQSKLDAPHRNTALSLAGVICQKHGAQWMLLSSVSREKSRFLHLLTHLVCVEVQLLLNGQEMSAVFPHTSLLSSCFSVMEQVVVLLAQATQDSQHILSEEDQLQLHTTLMDGFSVVVRFLQSASEQEAIIEEETTMEREDEKLLTIAAVRVLGVWMAEDSLALSSEVYSLLPFLVNLCKEEEDVLIFLLPGFSHLLAEDKPRCALISAGLCRQLVKHFAKQSTLAQAGEDALSAVKDQLCLLCSMGLTVCVCEPTPFTGEEVEESLSQWASLLSFFISKDQGPVSSLLNLHCAALCSMLLRRQQGRSQLPVPVVHDIIHVLTSWLMQWNDRRKQWSDEGGELWHITVRELSALLGNDSDMQKNMMHISDVTKIMEIMGTLSNSSNKLEDEQHAVMTSLSLFLSSIILETK